MGFPDFLVWRHTPYAFYGPRDPRSEHPPPFAMGVPIAFYNFGIGNIFSLFTHGSLWPPTHLGWNFDKRVADTQAVTLWVPKGPQLPQNLSTANLLSVLPLSYSLRVNWMLELFLVLGPDEVCIDAVIAQLFGAWMWSYVLKLKDIRLDVLVFELFEVIRSLSDLLLILIYIISLIWCSGLWGPVFLYFLPRRSTLLQFAAMRGRVARSLSNLQC